jgi:ABC-type nitrate/sulfonate/bicarbonate transport system substrate-binding protein
MGSVSRRAAILAAAVVGAVLFAGAGGANAADVVRLGKSLPHLFAYTPVDVGLEQGFFQKENLEVQVTAFNGAARQYQGLAAGAIDMSLSSGPGMVFVAKGLPAKAVAAMMGRPYLVVIVPADSPAKTIDDLKGKEIGVATVGSVTEWAIKEVARKRGWGPGDLKTVAIGGDVATTTASLVTHRVAAIIEGSGTGYQYEEKGVGRILADCGDYIDDFIMHTIFATDSFREEHPDVVRRFLKAWFATIDWINAHPAEALVTMGRVAGHSPAVAKREFDKVVPTFSRDGRFDRKALAVLAKSFVELGQTKTEPDMATLFTEEFLPSK